MQALAPYYLYIKFFHLFFVMMWAMSALGAYDSLHGAGGDLPGGGEAHALVKSELR